MSLFTSPVTLDTDRIFNYDGQIFDGKTKGSEYVETAAPVAEKSRITVKHDTSGSIDRHLLAYSVYKVPAASVDGVPKRMTFNHTIMADPLFTAAEVAEQQAVSHDAMAQTDVVKSLLNNAI